MGNKGDPRKEVGKAVMVPLIISHDDAINKDAVKRWNDIARDIKVDWVRIAQSELSFNVVIVGKFFNKGSWISEGLRKEHHEETADELGPLDRIPTTEERRDHIHLYVDREGSVCVRSSGTPPLHGVRLPSLGRGHPDLQ